MQYTHRIFALGKEFVTSRWRYGLSYEHIQLLHVSAANILGHWSRWDSINIPGPASETIILINLFVRYNRLVLWNCGQGFTTMPKLVSFHNPLSWLERSAIFLINMHLATYSWYWHFHHTSHHSFCIIVIVGPRWPISFKTFQLNDNASVHYNGCQQAACTTVSDFRKFWSYLHNSFTTILVGHVC